MRREDLFSHYERELLYLRRAGEGFSRAYPKVAKRLALGPEQAGDPHVERLIESFAFLTSRLQLNLDRQFPVFTEGLLNILYPHLAKPVPSCGIAKVAVDPEAGEMTEGYILPRGTELIASAGDDARCRFTTSTDLDLWPVGLTRTATVATDKTPFADEPSVNGALRIDIEALGGTPLEALEMRRLRVFINAEPSVAAAVYEALTTQVRQAAYVSDDGSVCHVRGGVHALPAGFGSGDTLLPVPSNSHPAYGLLQDVFVFPQKFLFIDITVPRGALSGERGSIVLGLGQPLPERMRIRPDTLLTGCVPVVNLFRRYAEPVRVDQRKTAYLVSPDALRDRITEVWSVDSVAGVKDDGERTPYVRLFSAEHALAGAEPEAFWFTRTEPSLRRDRGGTETWLSLVDLNMDPMRPAAETLLVHTLCTNRGLAEEVPAKAALTLEEPAPVGDVRLLYKPTMPRYRDGSGDTAWRLISQLSLNHLSLVSGPDALRALQEILTLHAMDDPAARVQIGALQDLTVRPIVQRVGQDAWRGFCRGLQVTIDVDERGFVGASPLVFGEVLSRFLGLYAAVNSFVQLRFRSLQRGGDWRTWPCISGDQHVL